MGASCLGSTLRVPSPDRRRPDVARASSRGTDSALSRQSAGPALRSALLWRTPVSGGLPWGYVAMARSLNYASDDAGAGAVRVRRSRRRSAPGRRPTGRQSRRNSASSFDDALTSASACSRSGPALWLWRCARPRRARRRRAHRLTARRPTDRWRLERASLAARPRRPGGTTARSGGRRAAANARPRRSRPAAVSDTRRSVRTAGPGP